MNSQDKRISTQTRPLMAWHARSGYEVKELKLCYPSSEPLP